MIVGYILIFIVALFATKLLIMVIKGTPVTENRTMFRYMVSGYGLPILLGFIVLSGAIMVNGALKNLKSK